MALKRGSKLYSSLTIPMLGLLSFSQGVYADEQSELELREGDRAKIASLAPEEREQMRESRRERLAAMSPEER
ncbi:MAG: hypothetical protein CMP96_06410, partial [Gammaproteobacteria bacterium]|nr:hypothetical protein [Gammaproteobacteria bacterium]